MAKKSKQHAHGATPATTALVEAGITFTLHPYEHRDGTTNFGEEAARALGVDEIQIFKTLVADVGGKLVVAVIPVAQQLDLKALATAFDAKKATLADPTHAARSTGYVVGGISPIGQRNPLPTVVDASADDFETIYVSAGRRGLQVELTAEDLRSVTRARSVSVAH